MLMAKSEGYNTYVMIFLVHLQAHLKFLVPKATEAWKTNNKLIYIITL